MAVSKAGRILATVLLLAPVFCLPADRAEAIGVGTYLDSSSGSGSYEWDDTYEEFDIDSTTAGFGFVLDSSPTDRSAFNYRMNIGYDRQDIEIPRERITLKMGGVVWENIFGFAIVRQPDFRWWVGPLLRIGYYTGETDAYTDSYGKTNKDEEKLFEVGVGMVTGVNFKVGQNAVFAPSVGVRYIGASGRETYKDSRTGKKSEYDYSGNSANIFVNVAMLFY